MSNKNSITELIEGVLRHGPDILSFCETQDDLTNYIDRVVSEHLNYPIPPTEVDHSKWFIPKDYYPNLIEYLYSMCETEEQRERVTIELELFNKHRMIDVLFFMKYMIDTLKENGVVWGVGRGSSVASYVLFLIGVHRIDSIKYNLPIEEFFKGE